MNFMDVDALTELVAEEFNATSAGNTIFVEHPNAKIDIWVRSDGAYISYQAEDETVAIYNSVDYDEELPLSVFANALIEVLGELGATRKEMTANAEPEPAKASAEEEVIAKIARIRNEISNLERNLEPFKIRFYKFLLSTDVWGYLSFSEIEKPVDEYELDFTATTKKEAIYSTSVDDWENEEIFTMPFSYTNDPENWEKNLTSLVIDDRTVALRAFRNIPVLQDYSLGKVSWYSAENPNVLCAEGKRDENERNELFIILKNEQIVYRAVDYFNTIAMETGAVESIGSFSG